MPNMGSGRIPGAPGGAELMTPPVSQWAVGSPGSLTVWLGRESCGAEERVGGSKLGYLYICDPVKLLKMEFRCVGLFLFLFLHQVSYSHQSKERKYDYFFLYYCSFSCSLMTPDRIAT